MDNDMELDPKARRDSAVVRLRRVQAVQNAEETRLLPIGERRRIRAEAQELKREYYKSLPQIEISRCPYDGNPVRKRMDVFGIDGPWWDVSGWEEPPTGDEHIVTYKGALPDAHRLVDEVPPGSEIHIGPAAPFVVPRLLSKEGVVCVIAPVPVLTGALLITYFADPILPAGESSEPWLRRMFYYTDEKGFSRWNTRDDIWDFDIARWLDEGGRKIYWAAPGDASMKLVTGRSKDCPYVDLPGTHSPQVLTRKGVALLPAPRESSPDYYD